MLSHHAEGASSAVVAGARPYTTSLTTLLTTHVLRDGELVLLVLKPSVWFIWFNSYMAIAIAALAGIALTILDRWRHEHLYYELAAFVSVGWLMWSTLQWMGQLYILTDMRVLRLRGVFMIDLFDCALRKVVRTRFVTPLRESLVRVGSIEIIPRDENAPSAVWQTIAEPVAVHEKLSAAIARAKQCGLGGD